MKFNLIGAGRLGKNLGLALSKASIAQLQGVYNLHFQNACTAIEAIGFGQAVSSLQELPAADIYFLCVSDDAIQTIVNHLIKLALCKPQSMIIHCSGVLNSSVLSPLKQQGCSIASFHPLKAFATGYLESNAFKQVHCVMEGDERVCHWLENTFTALDAHVLSIKPEAKATYHAGAAMASNYLITLASCAETLFLNAGIAKSDARKMILTLMQGNLDNLAKVEELAEVLTGPLMRGDINTLSMHLEANDDLRIKNLYKAAGLATLPLTKLSEEMKRDIQQLLNHG